jgi:hypothetical protein
MQKAIVVVLGLAAAALVSAQEGAQDAEKKKAREGEAQASEVRVYLLDKERKPAPLKDVSASLILEDPNGTKRTVPLSYVTPKGGDEKTAALPTYQFREVEQTSYVAGLCVVRAGMMDRPAGTPKGPPTAQDPKARPDEGVAPRMPDLSRAPYYKGDLMKEQMPSETSTASVVFTINGEPRHAKGFTWSTFSGGSAASGADASAELRRLEAAIRGHDMAGAMASLDRITAMHAPTKDAKADKNREKCVKSCEDIRASLKEGNRDAALDELKKLRSKCEDLEPRDGKK